MLNGKHAGTFGFTGVLSLGNGNKIISTGGGGMILTNDKEIATKAVKHLTTTAKTDTLNYFHDEVGYECHCRFSKCSSCYWVCNKWKILKSILKREKRN